MPSPHGNENDLVSAVALCRAATGLMDALGELYGRFDDEPIPAGAICLGGGACCRFDLAAHRLYASTVELALLSGSAPADLSRCRRRRCPYQFGPRCTARPVRPLGCRVFFCDTDTSGWCARIYEKYHRQVRSLHESFRVPYRYAELTGALTEILRHSVGPQPSAAKGACQKNGTARKSRKKPADESR